MMKLCGLKNNKCYYKTINGKCALDGIECNYVLEPRNLAKPNAQPALSDVRELLDAIYLTCDSYGHEDSRMEKTMSLYELRKVADRIKERVNFA